MEQVSLSRRLLNSKKCKVIEEMKENLLLNFKTCLSQTVISKTSIHRSGRHHREEMISVEQCNICGKTLDILEM
jgi:hypothetical protein